MNLATTVLAVYQPLPQWENFLAMSVALILGTVGVLLWALMFRKKRKRKHHRRRDHREQRKLNPTLAEVGGLPPVRPPDKPSHQPPPA